MVVMTEIGRHLAPEPVVHAALVPGSLIAELGTAGQRGLLHDIAAGQRLLAFAREGTTSAARQSDSWTLDGRKNPVLAGDGADTLVVSAALPGGGTGVFLVDATAVTRHPYRTFDGRRAARIDFDNTPAQPLGDASDSSEQIQRAVIRTQSALCAEAVGAMEEALRLTTEYLKTRKQFGVTLNNFQTLTQRAADMYVSLEMARSMSYYAAMSIADGHFDPLVASRAKLQIGRSGRHVGQEAIQLHGGIGVTAEYPIGHYRRGAAHRDRADAGLVTRSSAVARRTGRRLRRRDSVVPAIGADTYTATKTRMISASGGFFRRSKYPNYRIRFPLLGHPAIFGASCGQAEER